MSDQSAGEDADAARLWCAVACLAQPGSSDGERIEALLGLLSALERGSDVSSLRDAVPAVLQVARAAVPEDPAHIARYAVQLLERLPGLDALAELLGDATLPVGLRRRAGMALLHAGGEGSVGRLQQVAILEHSRDGGEVSLAADLERAVAHFRCGATQARIAGPFLFPRACPACFGDLLYLGRLDLPVVGDGSDTRRLSLWSCRACGSGVQGDTARAPRFLFEEVAAAWFPVLLGLFDACPRPGDPACDCEAHRNLAAAR